MDASENNELDRDTLVDANGVKREADGKWAAGQSGNPKGGKPKSYTRIDMQERATYLLRKYTVKDLSELYKDKKLLESLTIEDAALLALMKGMVQSGGRKDFDAFMNRLIGKPVQTTELTGKDGEQLFNDEARQSIRSKLLPELAPRGEEEQA